jgi:predicted HTH transcriptional regulator
MEIRTEKDLLGLVGESESMNLEFKGPEDFQLWGQNKQKVAASLSREASAFANTYGGQIILGVKETREKPRRLESIEGVDPKSPPIETIQRTVEDNIHPRLEGIRYAAIRLTGSNPETEGIE